MSELAPTLSVVIPSLDGNVDRVVASLRRQTVKDWELVVVTGVRPAGRARNAGIGQTTGSVILFVDDDAELGHERVLEQMLEALADPGVAVAGSSKVLPPGSTRLQRRIAREVPRWDFPILSAALESNPPLRSYGYSAVTTTCCVIRRAVLEEVGGFDERLPTGEDTELFYRIATAGYRFVVPAGCWAYHAPPGTMGSFVRKCFDYGVGHAREAQLSPDRGMAILPLRRWWARLALLLAPAAFIPSLFISVSITPSVRVRPAFRPIQAIARLATLGGYVWGYWGRVEDP